jgi:putative DNA primase/helicase
MPAEKIALALGGRRVGGCWMARCPAHADREPSLSVADGANGNVVVYCHAGCDQDRVIAALKSRGIWTDTRPFQNGRSNAYRHVANDLERSKQALHIWESAKPAEGTIVESYLRSRCIQLRVPSRLRFNAALNHPAGETWPVMVALVTRGDDDTPIGILRTYLSRDGAGKAPVEPSKMMLGACRGGSARLAAGVGELMLVGEGIETCLSAMQATGKPAWAALSTSGLRTLELPDAARDVIVLADADEPGEAAARSCAVRWRREGRRVRIARPPQGMDFNDVLVGRHVSQEAA